MSQGARRVCELLPSTPCDLYARPPQPPVVRTSLKRYILDPVLPMLTLLSMSVLTVVMLVLIVTAVADMDMRLPDGYVSIDPWTGVQLETPGGLAPEPTTYAGYVAPFDPREDGDSWSSSPATDRF